MCIYITHYVMKPSIVSKEERYFQEAQFKQIVTIKAQTNKSMRGNAP